MLFHMWNAPREPTPFGQVLLDLIERYGFRSQSEFARHVDIQSSTISRWVTKPYTPEPKLLAKVAHRLAADNAEGDALYSELLRAAGHLGGAKSTSEHQQPAMHPLARDLAKMLSEHSALSEEDRDLLARMVEKVLGGFR